MKSMLLLLVSALPAFGSMQKASTADSSEHSSNEIIEDFGTSEICISDKALKELGLTTASAPDEVRNALIHHGVNLGPEDKANLFKNGSVILIKSHIRQSDQLKDFVAQYSDADNFTIEGGRSPDGRYSIQLVRNAEPSDPDSGYANYSVVFRDNRTQKTCRLKEGSQGFCSFEGAKDPVNSQAWWSPDGNLVALCFRTSRHSREPYLYSVSKGTLHPIPLPDYDAVIYGRLGVKPFNGHYVRCPIAWTDNHTLKLFSWGDLNKCEITLHIESKSRGTPKASILEIIKGKPLEG